MSNELARIEFSDEQVELIKKTIAPKANENELKLFLYQCKRTGLDPLARQIYCIPIGGRMTIQTSIDGFRVVAERSGYYAGQDEPIFTPDEKGNILCCKVTVYKFSPNGQRYPASVGVAYWSEYAQNSPMWNKMKHTMISKCAEALALRKAFPQDLSGLYTTDEMQQAQPPQQTEDADDLKVLDTAYTEETPTDLEKQLLKSLVYNSDLEDHEKEAAFETIDTCKNYKRYQAIQHKLEARQLSIHQIKNPNQKDINNHLLKAVQ
jgi:phage recombination protein Bet